MNILCLLGGHSAVPSEVRNQGFHFTHCRCCGHDLIGMHGAWKSVPKGFRVVWKAADAPAASPVPRRLVRNVPMLRGNPMRQRLKELARAVSGAADLAGSALRLIGWSLAGHVRALRASLTQPFQPLRPLQLVLPLPPGATGLHRFG